MRRTADPYAAALVEAALEKPEALSKIAQTFLQVLRKNRDRRMLRKILERLEMALSRRENTLYAKVSFSTPPTDRELAALKQTLRKLTSYDRVEFEVTINPELVAGFRLQAQDIAIDTTPQGKSEKLKEVLCR